MKEKISKTFLVLICLFVISVGLNFWMFDQMHKANETINFQNAVLQAIRGDVGINEGLLNSEQATSVEDAQRQADYAKYDTPYQAYVHRETARLTKELKEVDKEIERLNLEYPTH
jgi:hypothetical protein